jgi:(1->4)-alpha-D-glucan 1-alpha-D-glucosylmutase
MDGTGRPPFVVVEKVLSGEESLPGNWPVEGTTGYDFLNEVAGLFVDPAGLRALDRHYRRTTRTRVTRAERTYDNKHNVLAQHFYADLATLAHTLLPVAEWLYPSSGISSRQLISALTAVTASLPVYRTDYSGRGALAEVDRRYIESALERAGNQPGALEHPFAFDVVRRALTLDIPGVRACPHTEGSSRAPDAVAAALERSHGEGLRGHHSVPGQHASVSEQRGRPGVTCRHHP